MTPTSKTKKPGGFIPSMQSTERNKRPFVKNSEGVKPSPEFGAGIPYNFKNVPLYAGSKQSQPKLTVSMLNSQHEQSANQVEGQVLSQPLNNTSTFTEEGTNNGAKKLSESGRNFYKPYVGSAVNTASIHIGGQADELARLSKAKALTVGNDIYIPQNKFSPETSAGRALLGHELAHVEQSQEASTQIFRDETEPHYPSADEQARLEKLLGRERTAKTVVTETTGAGGETVKQETVVMESKNLTEEERNTMADSLMTPLNKKVDSMVANEEAALAQAKSQGKTSQKSYSESQLFTIAEESRKEIYQKFGKYINRSVTLTQTDTSVADRIARDEILVKTSDMGSASRDLARTIANTFCEDCVNSLSGLNSESKTSVLSKISGKAVTQRPEFWEKAARLLVGGSYGHGARTIKLPLDGNKHSIVHELIHSLAHPAFRAALGDEDLSNEGFTEYFARQVEEGNSYPDQEAKVSSMKGLTNGPFLFDFGTGGSAEESLRLAYFSGRLDLIGWKPTSEAEKEKVEAAGGAPEWDPEKAKEYTEKYKAAAVAKQDTHNNILGIGVYFEKESGSDPTFNVRYARVLTQTEPYSRGRLLLEGQLTGSPVPKSLGGSLGIAGEFQEPYFYATGGVRFTGQAAVTGDANPKVDFSPFAGVGIRAWQKVRVGVEGFVLIPITGERSVQAGAGATVGLEF